MNKVTSTFVLTGLIGLLTWPAPAQEEPASGSPRLSELLGSREDSGYAQALEAREFVFPADHGPHSEYRNEWWYLTGNLDASGGGRFGFELTIFRFALAPPAAPAPEGEASAWRTRQAFIGHFAITDAARGDFHVAQRYARGALGLAGADGDPFRVWVEDWWIREYPAREESPGAWLLHADSGSMAATLTLVPVKPPVKNGIAGLSQKSAEAGNASYYYSIPRLRTDGALRIGDDVYDVSGLSWFDREWGSSALSAEQEGWDWFALQLADGSDLMFYRLRRTDGTADIHSAGTFIPAEGESVHLAHDDVTIVVRDYWDSPQGGRYPMAWSIEVPGLNLVLEVQPVLEAQELDTGVRYWEGAVDVTGQSGGEDVAGRGYVELTGYAAEE
jgi:predicted secreted hydrolase